jgi:succinate dehydrogenase / fumarate reductase, membrane anchor subunit
MKKHMNSKSKSGLHHYIAQRVTAIALIPLSAWFVLFTIQLSHAQSITALHRLLSSPCEVTAAVLFIAMFLYHGFLGVQVIVEDYIHCPILKRCILLGLLFASVISLVAGVISVVQLYITLKIFSPFVPY